MAEDLEQNSQDVRHVSGLIGSIMFVKHFQKASLMKNYGRMKMKYAMENIDTKKSSYHQSKWSVVFLYSFLRKDRVNGMKKLFISQPMRGKSDEDILTERKKAIESAEKAIGEPVEVIDSFFQEAPVDAKPLWFLGKSLELLAGADIAYFAKGWQDARGCRIEHTCAAEYNIDRIEP